MHGVDVGPRGDNQIFFLVGHVPPSFSKVASPEQILCLKLGHGNEYLLMFGSQQL